MKNIIEKFKSQGIRTEDIEILYNKIHNIGKREIEQKKKNIDEIIDFIFQKDIYYYDSNYARHKNRDPTLFKYISITNEINIKKLRDKKIWELFEKSNYKIKNKFYEILLDQFKNIKDYDYIFKLFPIKNIDDTFASLIKDKISNNEFKYKILDEKEEDYELIFIIIKNILICLKDKIGIDFIILNYNFTSKFFKFLLSNNIDKDINSIVNKFKKEIADYFIRQNTDGNANEDSLISLLSLSRNKEFSKDLLKKMEDMIMEEKDFYQKDDNINYKLFKSFFEDFYKKCGNIINELKLNETNYIYESKEIKDKILKDLSNSKVKYELIDSLIYEDNFKKKILTIVDGKEDECNNIYKKLKDNLEYCRDKIAKLEKIKEYYIIFFKIQKKILYEL